MRGKFKTRLENGIFAIGLNRRWMRSLENLSRVQKLLRCAFLCAQHEQTRTEKRTGMTDERINERIALLCGWKIFSHWNNLWAPPRRVVEYECDACPIPNYISDLNACHEFEKTLEPMQHIAYDRHLHRLVDETVTWKWHATARQRCEAFLRVHGQWEEEA